MSPDTALVGAEADEGGGGAAPAAALVVKLSATATSRGSYVAALLAERYTVTISPARKEGRASSAYSSHSHQPSGLFNVPAIPRPAILRETSSGLSWKHSMREKEGHPLNR